MLWLLVVVVRLYHPVAIAALHDTVHTHVEVCGQVVYSQRQGDGDRHLRIADVGGSFVAELVPYRRLARPRLHRWVCVDGIHRWDAKHRWDEVHPVERWRYITAPK